jgi:hypothetical protein
MNRLMERLACDFRSLTTEYEMILDRFGDESRDPTDLEAERLDQLRADMQPLGDRLIELRETEERMTASIRP